MKPRTHIPLSNDDPNEFYIVSNSDQAVTDNFTKGELHNPKTGLGEHPIAKQVVHAVQYLRQYFNIAIRITSSYRNYVPSGSGVVNPASQSPHMLAEALDFQFIVREKERDALMIFIRQDFEQKGPIFQMLFNEFGVRGFGVYDTFIHLDVVPVDLYDVFRRKRTAKYNGFQYAFWNDMQRLRYRKNTTFSIQPVMNELNEETVEVVEMEEKGLTQEAVDKFQSIIGSGVGFVSKLKNTDDGFTDMTGKNVWYTVLNITSIVLLLVIMYLLLNPKN